MVRSIALVPGRRPDRRGAGGDEVELLITHTPAAFALDSVHGRVYAADDYAIRAYDAASLRELGRASFDGPRTGPGDWLVVEPLRAFWLGGQRLLIANATELAEGPESPVFIERFALEVVESDAIGR